MSPTQTKVVLGFSVSAAILLCALTAILTVAIIGVGLVHILQPTDSAKRPRLFPNLTQPAPTPNAPPIQPAAGNAVDLGPLNTKATDELKNYLSPRLQCAKSHSPNYSTLYDSPAYYQLASPANADCFR